MEQVFNHDGYGILAALDATAKTERDAVELLVTPLAEAGVTAIDWCIVSTGAHNCRTRHGMLYDQRLLERFLAEKPDSPNVTTDRAAICRVIEHYAAQPLDLLDIVVKHGHAQGLNVYGNVRVNHSNRTCMMTHVPGRGFGSGGGARKDFRDETFHTFLLEIFEDLLAKGVDGISLDFERKAPFFPPETPQKERFDAVRAFVRKARDLTDKPVIARVCHEAEKGEQQGQDPEGWMSEGLIDAVIPATHNHEPDRLDWPVDRFTAAARTSPRGCKVWPQIWPTPSGWTEQHRDTHTPDAVVERADALARAGADGVYYFNWHSLFPHCRQQAGYTEEDYAEMLRQIAATKVQLNA